MFLRATIIDSSRAYAAHISRWICLYKTITDFILYTAHNVTILNRVKY